MSPPSETTTKRLETLSAHVEPELAAELRHLAEIGERSVSREVERAIKAHVVKFTRVSESRVQPPESAPGPRAGSRPGRAHRGRGMRALDTYTDAEILAHSEVTWWAYQRIERGPGSFEERKPTRDYLAEPIDWLSLPLHMVKED